LQQAIEALAAMEPIGVPNYFDDQRFGSLGPSGRFIGRALVDGQFEDALQLAICETHPTDRGPVRKLKSLLRDHWGAWEVLKTRLPRCNERSLVDYLIHHPQDFRGAFARLPLELSSIYLSAYQSYLWNRQLDIWIQNRWPANALGWIVLKSGRHAAPRMNVPDGLPDWERATLPLPSARLKTSNVALDEVLAQEGLTLAQIRVAGLERPYFSKGDRSVCLRPTQVQSAAEDDALNRGRQCCHLSFELPRGSYATMILKRLTALE
jgi:tRNA pseudouridine13 synthase